MKATSFAVAALFAAIAQAAPAPAQKEARAFQVAITFEGAGGASFFQSFPADNSVQTITNPLSVSKISSVGGGFCVFSGIDGSSTVVFGEQTVDVSPPQTQIRGSCDVA